MDQQDTGVAAEAPVALVTGGAVRIGAAIVERLHAEGYRVLIHCRASRAAAEALAACCEAARPDSAAVLEADLDDAGTAEPLIARARARWGRLDALVNNASSYFRTPLGHIEVEQFERLLASNLRAPLFLTQAAARAPEFSAAVNILDVHARQPRAGFAPYLAAKAGLWTLTEALALELAPRVRVNGVAPGHMIWAVNPALNEAEKAREAARIPLGRLGGAHEIARAVAFLLSEQAAYITGAVLPVDGGLRLG